MKYKVVNYFGRECVVTDSERKAYKYTRTITVDGKEKKVVSTIAAPKLRGIKGLALCGILKKNQTLDQWIARNDKKFRV